MAQTFDAARQLVGEQRRALLSRMAQVGSAAKAEFERAQADIAAQRVASVKAAQAGAAQRNAPKAMQDEAAATIASPYERQIADLRSSQASRQASLGQIGAAHDSYLGKTEAALPIVHAQAQREREDREAKLARERERDDIELQLARMRLQEMQSGGGLGGLSDAELGKRLMGAGEREREIAWTNVQATGDSMTKRGIPGAGLGRLIGLGEVAKRSKEERARSIGIDAGLDPSRVYGVVPAPEEPKPAKQAPASDAAARTVKISDEKASKIRATSTYKKMKEDADLALQGGRTLNDLKRLIGASYPNKPLTAQLILAEYKPLLPSDSGF